MGYAYRRRCAMCGVREDVHFTSDDCTGFVPKARFKGKTRSPDDDELIETSRRKQQIKACDELLRLLILNHGDGQ